ncbi:MAG: T9SS type A sorting domain-containing protein [Chitinophagales bacterium]|nr:T9SS type A sorting domain-containing protein [Chitinophagales bacterium]
MKRFSKYVPLFAALFFAANAVADAPSISYTPVNCTKVAPVGVSANISDADGINTASGFKPRLYFKKQSENNSLAATNDNLSNGWKYVEASNSTSPFSFDIDFTKLTSAVTKDDSIQYFIVAEDLLGEVAGDSATFSVAPSSVDLTSTQFPVSGIIKSFRTIKTYTGNLTIDPLGVANDTNFLSITKTGGLFEALNNGALSGNATVTIKNSSTTETGLFALNQWIEYNGCKIKDTASYGLKIKPFTNGIEVKGKVAGALIKLNGADRVTIDGRTSSTNATNELTFKNDSSANNSAVFHLITTSSNNGSEYNAIRYCNIVGGAPQNTTSFNTFGIYANKSTISTTLNEGRNNYNSFEKNNIKRVRYGIAIAGCDTLLNKGNQILFNEIGPNAAGIDAIGKVGIAVANQDGTIIRGNEVKFVGGDISNIADTADRAGIFLGTLQSDIWNSSFNGDSSTARFFNMQVDGNKIHNIINEAGLSSAAIAYLNKVDTVATNNIISNNMIYSILSNGNTVEGDHAAGIGIAGGNNDIVQYNSILLSGNFDNPGIDDAINPPAGIRINTSTTGSLVTNSLSLKNNAINVSGVVTNNSIDAYAVTTKDAADIWSSSGSNYNNLYTDSKVGGYGSAASYTASTTLGDWQSVFSPVQEQNSISTDPKFKSATDLHILSSSPCIEAGDNIAEGDIDFDGDDRKATAQATIGADQFGKTFVWVGREDNTTLNETNWRNFIAPELTGNDSLQVVVATENKSWTLSSNFTLADLTMKGGTFMNLDYNNIHAKGNVDLQGNSIMYSGVGSCFQSYNVEEGGVLILEGSKLQTLATNNGAVCNLQITSDSVQLLSQLTVQNDLIAKNSTTRILQDTNAINIGGDAKVWGGIIFDTTCTSLNCALININGAKQQYIDLRVELSSLGKISSIQIDKNGSGDDSKAMLGASLLVLNKVNLKKGKLISEGSNAESGFRYKTLYVLNSDSSALTRTNGNTNDAFFQGSISRAIGNAASYLFPVGFVDAAAKHQTADAPYFTPAVIEVLDNTGSGKSILVTYYDIDPDTANVGLIGKPYGDHTSAIEDGTGNWVDVKGDFVWHVEYSDVNLPYNIQLAAPFLNANNQDELIGTPNEYRIMKRSDWQSGNWGFQGAHDTASTIALLPDFTNLQASRRTGLNTFSGFGIGGNSAGGQVLPVKMVSIAAKSVENKWIELTWQTAAEINNAGFEIQRSTDGEYFETISWKDGAGNSTSVLNYSYNDEKVKPGIIYYYRLLQKDFDGNSELTNIVSARLLESGTVKWMQLMPNPATSASSAVINASAESVATISITDMKGVKVYNQEVKIYSGINTLPLDIKTFTAGNYIVTFKTDDDTFSKQLIVR